MNYANLLARGLSILYCMFLLLFAFGEGILEEGYVHAISAAVILVMMIAFKHNPIFSSLTFFLLFVVSVSFFNTYSDVVRFFILSAPLMVVSILFLLGRRANQINSKTEATHTDPLK